MSSNDLLKVSNPTVVTLAILKGNAIKVVISMSQVTTGVKLPFITPLSIESLADSLHILVRNWATMLQNDYLDQPHQIILALGTHRLSLVNLVDTGMVLSSMTLDLRVSGSEQCSTLSLVEIETEIGLVGVGIGRKWGKRTVISIVADWKRNGDLQRSLLKQHQLVNAT
tara:strand:+ start:65 stop:571 length:507 start_codon:yes stop_codon:yes gene_type:complete